WPWCQRSGGPAGMPLDVKEMRVRHYRDRGKTLVGDLRTSSLDVRLNDNVLVLAELTAPAHYYLIAFNPRGSVSGLEQLCQPEGQNGKGAEATRPDLRTEVEYPRHTHDFFLDATDLQPSVLPASPKPLP